MSNYPKVSEGIFDTVKSNTEQFLEIVGQYFPEAIKDGEVDFTALKEEMGEFSEVGAEHYSFTWAGKQAAKKEAQADILGRTLRFKPDDSVNADTTENIYIEGDNLEALKLLKKNYYGKIKMIYIDPPYNTGSDFVYRDDFTMSEEELAELSGDAVNGERLQKNSKDKAKYHTNWLNMMYPRLKLARDLLSEDGVIFISIDNNEIENMIKICNQIFNEANCLGIISNTNNPKGRSDDKFIATAHEYILVFAKNISETEWFGFEPTEEITKRYNKTDSNGKKYREIDLRKTGENDLREDRPNLFYYFYYNPETGDFFPDREDKIIDNYIQIKPQREDGKEGNWRWGMDTTIQQISDLIPKFMPSRKIWGIMQKDYLEGRALVKPTTSWTFKDVNSERGTEEFINLHFDKRIFAKPKPIGTLKRCLKLCANCGDIVVLDFFSGSAATAQAVMEFNVENNRKHKFIMVQLPEETAENSDAYKNGYKNICEIGKERIRRAAKKIHEDNPDAVFDDGFKVFEVADTNIRWNKINDQDIFDMDYSKGEKDNIDFMPGVNDIDIVYEIMLKQYGIPLSTPIEKLSDISDRTYIFADAVVVCLDADITDELIEKLAAIEPIPAKYILRDSAFDDDIEFKDVSYRRLSALIANHQTDEEKKSKYNNFTVEFI